MRDDGVGGGNDPGGKRRIPIGGYAFATTGRCAAAEMPVVLASLIFSTNVQQLIQ